MQQEHIKLLTTLKIGEQYIVHTFGAKTLQRAIDYFHQDRVKLTRVIPFDNGSMEINAEVLGSLQQTYEATIMINAAKGSRVRVESDCDCPVNFQCKHGLATIFAFAQFVLDSEQDEINEESLIPAKEVNIQTAVDHWLQQINTPSAKLQTNSVNAADKKQYQLLYKLQVDPNSSEILNVETVKAKTLLRGGFSKEAKQDLSYIANNHQYENIYFEDIDQQIAHLLVKKNVSNYYSYSTTINNHYELEGDLGVFILNKLLQTGRCFWETIEQERALSSGIKRDLEIEWLQDEERYLLQQKVQPPIDTFFHLVELFYVDQTNHQIGSLSHDGLQAPHIEQLLNAPPIPEAEAEKVSMQLLQRWPNTDIPLPVNLGIEDIIIKDLMPTANCLLYSYELADHNQISGKRRIHVLRLRFTYDDYLISPDNHQHSFVQIQDKSRLKIERQLHIEDQLLKELKQYQFVSLPDIGEYGCEYELCLQHESEISLAWMWHDFQEEMIPKLEAQGWQFELDESFSLNFSEADEWYADLDTLNNNEEAETHQWFSMDLGIEINQHKYNLLPILVNLIATEPSPQHLADKLKQQSTVILPVDDNRWVKLPSNRLQTIFNTLVELYDKEPLNSDGNLVFNKQQSIYFAELLNDPNLRWKGETEIKALNQKLQNFSGIEAIEVPQGLQSELRDYQQSGLNWLQFLRDFDFNGILADDMGLGKTIQTLVHLLYEKQHHQVKQPSLIVAPTSLMGNWIRETQKFTPDLKIQLLHGNDRRQHFKNIDEADIVLTTYPLVLRDQVFHLGQHYHYIILDESQHIKNARSKTTQTIFNLSSNYRLCLTGTPMENHLGEIWSMFHFLMPGYLGNTEKFNRLFKKPIEIQSDYTRQQQLSQRLKPFMLRRTKSEVANELPPKTEIIRSIPISGKQRDLYETIRLAMDKKVQLEINKKGLARSQIMILDALLKLRQICCDPSLLPENLTQGIEVNSAKMELLMDLVPEMIMEGRKIIIFSQFVKMLNIIEKAIKEEGISYTKLTGQTKKRDEAINAFQQGEVDVFLISLKAGGVGLNLTAADTVIHYDPWWNPAVENQATDRAHRLGQDKPVFVYKLLTTETVEEKILDLQGKKQKLADRLYDSNNNKSNPADDSQMFSQNELLQLLQPID